MTIQLYKTLRKLAQKKLQTYIRDTRKIVDLMTVRVRFAPSPTGYLHIGNARAALLNFLIAKKNGGKFILRIDDTDIQRSTKEYEDAIIKDLNWLGLKHDEFFRQSERGNRYLEVIEHLKDSGRLYPCYETGIELDIKRKRQISKGMPPIYDRESLNLTSEQRKHFEETRKPHYRFLIDHSKDVFWNDLIRGDVHFSADKLSDPVLVKEDGTFLYTLTSVVDDFDTDITHVIRGEDHVANTAVQIQLFQAIGDKPVPSFAHFTLLLDENGAPLSKRIGSFTLNALKDQGIEPMTLNSLLGRLGTSLPIEPFMSLDDMLDSFSLSIFSRTPPRFSEKDLVNLNHKLLKDMPYGFKEMPLSKEAFDIIKGNIYKFSEIFEWEKILKGEAIFDKDPNLKEIALITLPNNHIDQSTWKNWTNLISNESNLKGKELFIAIRKLITGRESGPEMKYLLPIMGYNVIRKILES